MWGQHGEVWRTLCHWLCVGVWLWMDCRKGSGGETGSSLCVEWGLVGAALGVSVSKAEWGRAGLRHVLQKGSSGPSSCRTCGRVRGGQGRPAHQAQPGPRGLELGALAGSSNCRPERELPWESRASEGHPLGGAPGGLVWTGNLWTPLASPRTVDCAQCPPEGQILSTPGPTVPF